jgi:hypothetical protein
MAKQKVNFYVMKDNDSDNTTIVIVEDGGLANAYMVDRNFKTEYYGSRITAETELENLWDELGEGKMYVQDWDGSSDENPLKDEVVDDEMIMDMVHWLYATSEEVEYVRHDLEWTDENFYKVKAQLKFDEE